jgi:hypothetical protein
MLKPRLLAPWFLTLCLVAGAVLPVRAQTAGVTPEVAPVCGPDVKKFCAGIRPGEGKIAECLKKNVDALDPDCKVTVAEGRPTIPPSPCKADIEKLCPTIDPGQGRIAECLRKNAVLLSAQCRVYQVRIKD